MTPYNEIFDQLFPICRSISGDGYRKSVKIISKFINFKIHRIKSGTRIFDWIVPDEWNIEDAFIRNEKGIKICNFKKNNLSVVNYSKPINKKVKLNELQKNLYSIPKSPNLVPYVTSYYKKNWGFCISENERKKLKHGTYHAVIKSSFKKGHIEFGTKILEGDTNKDFLISSYLCHPSMANNELSGPLVLIGLYKKLYQLKTRKLNYIFLINPETIGSICFLHKYGQKLKKTLQAGLVLTCLGGPKKKISYKKSRQENSSLDKLFIHLSKKNSCLVRDFDPSEGSDERQYCSSEFNLPVGQASRTIYGQYKEYHTDGDTKQFMSMKKIEQSVNFLFSVILLHEKCLPLFRNQPYCELQLGKKNLYPEINSPETIKINKSKNYEQLKHKIMLYILSYADGNHDIIDIAETLDVDIKVVENVYDMLKEKKLIL